MFVDRVDVGENGVVEDFCDMFDVGELFLNVYIGSFLID